MSILTPEAIEEIKRKAEAADKATTDFCHDLKVLDIDEVDDFAMAMDPPFVLDLLASYEELRRLNELLEHRFQTLSDLHDYNMRVWLQEKESSTDEIEKLRTLLKEARETLSFYADKNNQIAPIYDGDGRGLPGADFTQPYRIDKGERARSFLTRLDQEMQG